MSEYTDDQYIELLVARQFGARKAVQNLREHISNLAAQTDGDAWLTDPRRAGLEIALNVLVSHVAGGAYPLPPEVRPAVARLLMMEDNLDKRDSPHKIPLYDASEWREES